MNRRQFLAGTAAAAATIPAIGQGGTDREPGFRSRWDRSPDRVWPGPEYWSNPLQDWRIAGGRLECQRAAPGRNLHVLSCDLADRPGDLRTSVRLGALDGGPVGRSRGSAGFSVGVRGPLGDYRNNLVHGNGFDAGLRADGVLFLGSGPGGVTADADLDVDDVELRFLAEPDGETYRVRLSAVEAPGGRLLGELERSKVPADWLVGNLALFANVPPPRGNANGPTEGAGVGRWWFADWMIDGSKVEARPDRTFGPILFNQYTLHRRTLKMTVQMPPLGADDDPTVRLQLRRAADWRTVAESPIDPVTRTALFRVDDWDDRVDTPYRLTYVLRSTDGTAAEDRREGIIRRDPVDADVLTVADISCNAHYAFPNTDCVAGVAKLDPDLLAFTGDQYYESTGGFGVERGEAGVAVLDMLRKWYQHGWTWRELMKDRPTVQIPDDHDVYHGNLWGEGGVAAPGNTSEAEAKGGYKMVADFVNAVHRVQTAHHPDSPAEPGAQGIIGYYGPLTYGRVSFAILADRQYKTGPDGEVPPTTSGRADHVVDPGFDPATADLPGLVLLGDPQLRFLDEWAEDWRGADLKAAISQTIFTAMATHHGQVDNRLVADYDTNAWPQSARDAAVRSLRRAFAFHLAGDQHLPAVVHYGLDEHRDAAVAFAAPAVNNLYPRWFRPDEPGAKRPAGAPGNHGDFRDSFGHPMTVLAVANPKLDFRRGVLEAETDKSSGFGLVRFHKPDRTITVECWPLLADPTSPGSQFAGWPVTVSQLDCGAGGSTVALPILEVRGVDRPVIQVIDESSDETIYTVRVPGPDWRPFARVDGPHTIRALDPETGRSAEARGVSPGEGRLELTLS